MDKKDFLEKARKAREHLDRLAGLKNKSQADILESLSNSGVLAQDLSPTLSNIHAEIIRDNYGLKGDSIKDVKKYYENFAPDIDVRMNPKMNPYGTMTSSLGGDKIRLNPDQGSNSLISTGDHELEHLDNARTGLAKERPKLLNQLDKSTNPSKTFEKIKERFTKVTDQFGVPYNEMTPEKMINQIEMRKDLANAPAKMVDELAPTVSHFEKFPKSNYELDEVARGLSGAKRMRFAKLMKSLGPIGAVLGAGAGALASGDVMAGVADAVVPGGIEGLGEGSDNPSGLTQDERIEAIMQAEREAAQDIESLKKPFIGRKIRRYLGE